MNITPIIDFHAHVGTGAHKQFAPEELLRQMDQYDIERSVLCPVDEYIAVKNREGNEYLAKTIREYKDRFYGLAVANPWYGAEAVATLRHALDNGLQGLKINSILQGFMLCDPVIEPLLEVAQECKVPVYAHTGSMNNALPFQLLELATRFPEVSFVMGHMAYSDFWYDVIPVLERGANILVETSHAPPDLITAVIRKLGVERVLFGSDVPESGYAIEIGKFEWLNLSKTELDAVFSANARKLLK
jgi:predicted TIM-barrel fold metal-dependent hydrolase